MQFGKIKFGKIQFGKIQFGKIQFGKIQFGKIQFGKNATWKNKEVQMRSLLHTFKILQIPKLQTCFKIDRKIVIWSVGFEMCVHKGGRHPRQGRSKSYKVLKTCIN